MTGQPAYTDADVQTSRAEAERADVPTMPRGCRGWERGLCAGCATCDAAALAGESM